MYYERCIGARCICIYVPITIISYLLLFIKYEQYEYYMILVYPKLYLKYLMMGNDLC